MIPGPPDPSRAGRVPLAEAHAHVLSVVSRASSSFWFGMRILSKPRRLAMYALYAFGREVDDVVDEGGNQSQKLTMLDQWRQEVDRLFAGQPAHPTTMALLDPVRRYGLPKAEFLALIDGMEMDARESMHAPNLDGLALYCRRAAGTVGVLSLKVFGAVESDAEIFGLALADGLQLTNILRDLEEDASRDRLYLPAELLRRHGLEPTATPREILADARVSAVCEEIATMARCRFADADKAMLTCQRRRLRPALLMMGVYEHTLDRLEQRGFAPGQPRVRLSKGEKLAAAIKQGLFRPKWQPST